MALAVLWPLAIWILISGLDDFFIDLVGLGVALRGKIRRSRPSRRDLLRNAEKPIAILVPLWQEAAVIARMVQQNSASILYKNYHFFIGAYPNDEPTLREIRRLEARYSHVHLAVCPHDGPTSKADCLNWIFQNMLAYEQSHQVRFEVLVTHDAEDVIHSDSLHWINYYSGNYEMVQVPVLPVPTRFWHWTHGVYIDEFTEYQARDMPARQAMGAFVPSNGVGTGFRRDALDALAQADNNLVFEPVCLTEDYENGLRLRLHGANQIFLPFQSSGLATREYFPQTLHAAIQQRTRWVTGISLQTWDRHGWPGGLVQKYWLWRDRKGLIGNPASLMTNVLFAYGSARWMCGAAIPESTLLYLCSVAGIYRVAYRIVCVGRVFGPALAFTVPIRVLVSNYINSAATLFALRRFFTAKWKGLPLVWVKTQHAFPSQAALGRRTVRLGEVLLANGYLTQQQVSRALSTKPSHLRFGEHLIASGLLDEDTLYEALSLQRTLPQGRIDPGEIRKSVARSLPSQIAVQRKLIPFKVDMGTLFIAGPELPTLRLRHELGQFTSLAIEFHLVTPSNYRELANEFLLA